MQARVMDHCPAKNFHYPAYIQSEMQNKKNIIYIGLIPASFYLDRLDIKSRLRSIQAAQVSTLPTFISSGKLLIKILANSTIATPGSGNVGFAGTLDVMPY